MLLSHSVMSDSLRPYGLQPARLPCPSLSPRVCSDSCPLSCWCRPTISSSVTPFSFCHQSYPASRSFPISWLCASIRWSKYWNFNFSISPSNDYSGLISFRMDWFDLLAVQGTLKSLLQPQFKNINSSVLSLLYGPTHIHTQLLEKPYLWLYGHLLAKWCLCFLICCLDWS